MGIVKKQSIIGSLLVYAGAALGFVTSVLLFPNYFTTDQIGLISLLLTYAVIFAQFASGGFLHTITRLFPYFRDNEKQHNGFLFITLAITSICTLFMIGVYFLTEPYIIADSIEANSIFADYVKLIIPLGIFITFFNALDFYTKALFNATRGIMLKEVLLRVLIIFIFAFYFFKAITFKDFIYLYVAAYGVIMIYITISLIVEKQFSLKIDTSLLTPQMKKDMWSVSFYGLVITAASFIAISIDRVMIEKIVEVDALGKVGIYATCTYFATMVILPSRPLMKISSTIIAEAWKRGDNDELQNVYSKSSITQLIVGSFVFIGIWVNIDNIFAIIPAEYYEGKWVMFFIGLFYLCDMAMGANNQIIGSSKKYKMLSNFTVILIILLIVFNLILIPEHGITGAAIASFAAKFLYNVTTWWYSKVKFNLQPFTKAHVLAIVVTIIAFSTSYLIPAIENLWIDILVRSSVLTIIFGVLIYLFKVSSDINDTIEKVLLRR